MRVEKTNKAFAYRVPIGDYNYLQCTCPSLKVIFKGTADYNATPKAISTDKKTAYE